jgi:rhamnose utilization protein RhaD (predicted bifunctional aldolase and dehydrogenase)
MSINELCIHSDWLGSNPDFVQASGGNTSWKSGTTIWVKGSGQRLKDALSKQIFSQLFFESLSEDDVVNRHDFSELSSNSISPSIETNFHILLKKSFVTHLHSLGSLSVAISSSSTQSKFSEPGVVFIPYARPGVQLAYAIRAINGYQESILILQNHGVIFSGHTTEEIQFKIQTLEKSVKDFFTLLEKQRGFPIWEDILISGVLTPDEAVFLGRKPFIKSQKRVKDSVAINKFGELLFPDSFTSDRIEMAHFYVRVAKMIEMKTEVSYLTPKEVDSLLDWDKEIKRIELAQ